MQITPNEMQPKTISFNSPVVHPKKAANNIKTTKYTLITFLPISILNQFRRVYNVYFLLAALSVLSGFSSVSPITQITPLAFVLIVTCIKEAWEDYQRYVQDNIANFTLVSVLRNNSTLETIKSKDLNPGDLIYYKKGEKFSVDAILISTSYGDGSSFVDTAELDGETNLKRRVAPFETLNFASIEELSHFKAVIECEIPNQNLVSFQGNLQIPDDIILNNASQKYFVINLVTLYL